VIDEARRVAIPGITARNRDISDSRGRALFAALSSMFSWLKRTGETRQSRFHDNRHDAGVGLEPSEGPPGRGDARRRARGGSRGRSAVDLA